MNAGQEGVPLILGQGAVTGLAMRPPTGPGAAEDKRPGIAWIPQDLQGIGVDQGAPDQLPAIGSTTDAPGERELMLGKVPHHAHGRTCSIVKSKERLEALPHLAIRMQDDFALGIVGQAHRQGHAQFPAPGLVANAALEAGAQHVQFGLAHGALETQQQPVVEVRRIVQAVFVQNQRIGQGADLQETMPVAAVAGQAGDFQSQHDAGAAQAHLGDQLLKTLPIGRRGPGDPLVGINDHDLLGRPAQGDGALLEGVLPLGALGVVEHLLQRGLADVQIGIALEMFRGDFLMRIVFGIHGQTSCRRPGRARIMLASTGTSCRVRFAGSVTEEDWITAGSAGDAASAGGEGKVAGAGQACIQATNPWRKNNANPHAPSVPPLSCAQRRKSS